MNMSYSSPLFYPICWPGELDKTFYPLKCCFPLYFEPQTRTPQKSHNFDIILKVSHQKVHPWNEHKKWVYNIFHLVWIFKSAFLADFGISLRFFIFRLASWVYCSQPPQNDSSSVNTSLLHMFPTVFVIFINVFTQKITKIAYLGCYSAALGTKMPNFSHFRAYEAHGRRKLRV